jgi:hypothetical protein
MSGERGLTLRWPGPRALANTAAAGALAIGLATAMPPALEAWRAAPARAEQRVVFGEELQVVDGAAVLQRAPRGGVAVFVGGIRQAEKNYRLAGRSIRFFCEPPAVGEKVVVDYAY